MFNAISSLAQQLPIGGLLGGSGAPGAGSSGLLGGLLGGGMGDMLSIGGLGNMAESLLDGLGAPDWAGDLARMFGAAATGDIPGAVGGYLDAMGDAFADIGLPEVGEYVEQAADLTSTFGGMATGSPGSASGMDADALSGLFGEASSSDTNALAALIGALGDETAGSAAGSVRL